MSIRNLPARSLSGENFHSVHYFVRTGSQKHKNNATLARKVAEKTPF